MPLILVASAALSLVSLAVLLTGGYLVWSWCEGAWIADQLGRPYLVREPWRLAVGLGLLAVSFLGKWPVTLLLARLDASATRAVRSAGEEMASPTGSRLYVERHGPPDAPTVILTHGWGMDSTIWFYLRRALARRFHVISWDLPGLGKSHAASLGAVNLESFAEDLKFLLTITNGQATVLLGHSIGGMVIQTLVRDHPGALASQVAGVVLVNTTYTNPLRTMALSRAAVALRWPVLEPLMRASVWLAPVARLCAWQSYLSGTAHIANRLGFGPDVARSQLEQTTLLATRNSQAVLAKGNLAMFRWEAEGALESIAVPVLILAGDSDIVTKLEASRVLARETPGGELAIVPRANHMGFLERFDAYNPMIEEFCARCTGADPGRAAASVGVV